MQRSKMLEPVAKIIRAHDYYVPKGDIDAKKITFRIQGKAAIPASLTAWGDK